MDKAQVWHAGEDVAAEHLAGLGWRIVERNWRCRAGELDIIAIEPGPEPVVVFCEVKTRRGTAFGQPVEAITRVKLAKLRELSLLWLRAAGHTGANLRIDAIGVLLSQHGPASVDHRRGIC